MRVQGACYENFVGRIVDITEQNYLNMSETMAETHPGMTVNRYMTHMHIDPFVHLLTHESDESNAQQQMKRMMEFL